MDLLSDLQIRMDERQKYRHNLKGSIRRLKFVIDNLEDSYKSKDFKDNERYFKDFETSLEKIREDWAKYKLIHQKESAL